MTVKKFHLSSYDSFRDLLETLFVERNITHKDIISNGIMWGKLKSDIKKCFENSFDLNNTNQLMDYKKYSGIMDNYFTRFFNEIKREIFEK